MAHLSPHLALTQARMMKRANPQLETGEIHPKGMNFMGPGTKLLDRFSLKYKGKVGTPNYFLPSSLEDYYSIWHDLAYFVPNDYIKYKSDVDFLNNQEKHGKFTEKTLLGMSGISAQTLKRTFNNLKTLLNKKKRKEYDEEYEYIDKQIQEIRNKYDEFLDNVGYFEPEKKNDFVLDVKDFNKSKKLYEEFHKKLENYFNKYLVEKFNTNYKLEPLEIENFKFITTTSEAGATKATEAGATEPTFEDIDFEELYGTIPAKDIPSDKEILKVLEGEQSEIGVSPAQIEIPDDFNFEDYF
jgi:hypothetical protein